MAKQRDTSVNIDDARFGVAGDFDRDDDEFQIDLTELFYRMIERMRYIVVAAVAGAVIAALFTMMFITPKYTATSKIYVKNNESAGLNLADLQIGSYLAADYMEVFSNWHVHEQVIEKLDLDYTYDELSDMINIVNPNDTRILYVEITSANAAEAQAMANAYASVAKEFIAEKMETSEPTTFEEALLPSAPTSPSLTLNTLLGLFAGLVISCGWIVIQYLKDDRIRTSDDVERFSGLTTLGMMPLQTAERAKQEKKEIRKQLREDARNERRAESERSKRV